MHSDKEQDGGQAEGRFVVSRNDRGSRGTDLRHVRNCSCTHQSLHTAQAALGNPAIAAAPTDTAMRSSTVLRKISASTRVSKASRMRCASFTAEILEQRV